MRTTPRIEHAKTTQHQNAKDLQAKIESALIFIGIGLRFYGAATPELWRDEAFSVRAAMFPLDRMLEIVRNDTAPFFHYYVLHYWIQAFGNTQFSVRLPSILAGCLSILVFRQLLKNVLSSSNARLYALALYVTNPHIISYDQMARVYSIVLLLVLMTLLSLVQITSQVDGTWSYVRLTVATTIGLYAYNLFPLVALANLIFLLYLCNRRRQFKVLASYFVSGLIYLPLFLTFTLKQIQLVRQTHLPFYFTISLFILLVPLFAGQRPPSATSKFDMGFRLLSMLVLTVVMVVVCTLWLRGTYRIQKSKVKILWRWMLFVLALSYLYSLKSAIVSPRYFLFFLPILCIVLAELIAQTSTSWLLSALALGFLAISLYELNVGFIYRGDVRTTIKDLARCNKKNLVMVPDGVSFHTLQYYIEERVKIYDPQRKLPYYDGVAIFTPEDYMDNLDFTPYDCVNVVFFRAHPELSNLLVQSGFKLKNYITYKGADYSLEKWFRVSPAHAE